LELYESKGNEIDAMIGDTNIFLTSEYGDETGELEIMIAEEKARGKGFAFEALSLMMEFCQKDLGIKGFVAKIGMDNLPSISLFTKKLGFTELSRSEVFQEITFQSVINKEI
jgi:RimJ/RimL family protein N-acetyltransferase